jgi:transketolase
MLHGLPVRIVGIGGGFEYGHAGPTHHGLEDVGVMRVQPGITVIAPADAAQTRTALEASWDIPGPVYYRLGKDDKTIVPGLDGRFAMGRVQVIAEGEDLLLVVMGSVASEAATAARELAEQGISCTVAVVPCLNPAPTDDLAALLARFPLALTVEAHYIVGGVGSLVSEVVAERGLPCRVVRCGVRTAPDGRSGSQNYLHQLHGLSSAALIQVARRELQASEVVQ